MAFPSINYTDLAQLVQPRIPGESLRPGLSAGASLMYMQDRFQRDNLIQQAMPVADMNAQMQMQAGQEYMQGAEGRGLEQQAKMEELRMKLQEMRDPNAITAKIAKRVAELSESKQKELQAKSHIFADLASTSDPAEIKNKLEYYGEDAIYNGQDLRKRDPKEVQIIAKGITQGLKLTPKYALTMDKVTAQGESYNKKEQLKAASNERIAALRAQAQIAAARLSKEGRLTAAQITAEKRTLEQLVQKMVVDLMSEDGGNLSLKQALEEVKPLVDTLEKLREKEKLDIKTLFGGDKGNKKETPAKPSSEPKARPKQVRIRETGKIADVIWEGDRAFVMDNGVKKEINIQ